jgi:hypothetical protein
MKKDGDAWDAPYGARRGMIADPWRNTWEIVAMAPATPSDHEE